MDRDERRFHDLGIKSLDELWEQIKDLGKHNPIICNGLMLKHIAEDPISNEYVLAAMVLVLAGDLETTQKQLIGCLENKT